jgi:hypothetical protein
MISHILFLLLYPQRVNYVFWGMWGLRNALTRQPRRRCCDRGGWVIRINVHVAIFEGAIHDESCLEVLRRLEGRLLKLFSAATICCSFTVGGIGSASFLRDHGPHGPVSVITQFSASNPKAVFGFSISTPFHSYMEST